VHDDTHDESRHGDQRAPGVARGAEAQFVSAIGESIQERAYRRRALTTPVRDAADELTLVRA
jgi:hypothetical protein